MARQALITGGAGFIGSHLADELLAAGYSVRVLDSLMPQVHGEGCVWPIYLSPEVELIIGDVRDAAQVRQALDGVDVVIHFASMVGVGQSMYHVSDYVSVNDLGTAVLLQALIERPVARLLVASSMSIYGEGLYRTRTGEIVEMAERTPEQLRQNQWDPRASDGSALMPVPTPETKRPNLASVYALSKYVQERMCLMVGQAYGIETACLRFFNVYGSRQALSNPYTGVLAIFASRLLNGRPPLVFEDGLQRRDFVHVHDVARACRMAIEAPAAAGQVLNMGSGNSYTVRELGLELASVLGKTEIEPEITGRYRVGDIRHCFSDMTTTKAVLGFEPKVDLATGMLELAEWLSGQIAIDKVDKATEELVSRGLVA